MKWRWWQKEKLLILDQRQREILDRENREAARGQGNPFELNGGQDATTKATQVGFTVSGPTAIIGKNFPPDPS